MESVKKRLSVKNILTHSVFYDYIRLTRLFFYDIIKHEI